MMPKSDTINAIRWLNPSACPDFLAGFSSDELARYLDRLTNVSTRRHGGRPAEAVELDEPVTIDAAIHHRVS